MNGHAIILPVVLPAVAGAAMVLGLRRRLAAQRLLAFLSVLVLGGLAVGHLAAAAEGPAAYFLGDWPAPFGIVLMRDRLAAAMLALVAALALAVLVHVAATGWDRRGRHFHALFQFQLMGLNGAFLTGDAFNLFVFFEVMLIASYGLMVHGAGAARLRAGVQYIAFNLVGSTLFLFALALTYAVTGTLNMADIGLRVAALPAGEGALIRVAAVMMVAVFAIKGALVPLQFWLPGTYANAPGPVAALFAVMTKVGAVAALRAGLILFPPGAPAIGGMLGDLLLPAALVTALAGALGVAGAASLPRQAGFAAIASMGVVFAAIGLQSPAATAAGLYYLIHSTLAGAALFLVADLAGTPGAQARRGWLAALFMAAAVASAGLPPLSGFVGKLMVLEAAQGAAMAPVWGVVLVSSLILVIGFARSGSAAFWEPPPPVAAPASAPQPGAWAGTGLLLAGLVALTLLAAPARTYLDAAAAGLHDPSAYAAAALARAGGM